ncbi:hypothetical protein ACSFXN_12890 [Planococcus sp. 1R117A]|uniref:hypothetical protein n=1 Tax=Planococcus sp. 1R117A TaxID=3447020 RepID=UPI003EDC9628
MKTKLVLLISLFLLSAGIISLLSGNDSEKVEAAVGSQLHVAQWEYIEIFDDRQKAVAFVSTNDGAEQEVFLEKNWFEWNVKKAFAHESVESGKPIHLTFSSSTYSKEDPVILIIRTFDEEIKSVDIQTAGGETTTIEISVAESGPAKGFGILETADDTIYEAEFISKNSDGELLYAMKAN